MKTTDVNLDWRFAEAARLTALSEKDRNVYRGLARLRARLGVEAGVPAYRVLSNRQLLELAEAKPIDDVGLRSVRGIGPLLVRAYGAEIITIVRGATSIDVESSPVTSRPR